MANINSKTEARKKVREAQAKTNEPRQERERHNVDDAASLFAALAVNHRIEHQTGWSIKKFVRTARRYRTVQVRAGRQILTAADPLPDDLREAITRIDKRRRH